MKMKWLVGLIVGIVVTGCTTIHRGVVAMKISDTKAHVCVNNDEVQVGDNVKIYRSACSSLPAAKGRATTCKKELVGTGTVTETLNDHYSVVSVPAGTDLKEGDLVER